MTAAILLAAAIGGPFPLLCTPYADDGSLAQAHYGQVYRKGWELV